MKLLLWFLWAFNQNTWLWFHILAGAVGGKIGLKLGLSNLTIMGIIFGLAIGWEVIEYLIENQIGVYRSLERWAWDSFGDIFGALTCCLIVII